MQLLIIRHGIAEDGTPDEERALTDKGRRRMRKIAAGLRRIVPSLEALATSPLVRARQTADIVAHQYDLKPEIVAELAPAAPLGRLREWLAAHAHGVVAIVGHEPGLSTFASWLISARPESHLVLKKGGACLIDLNALEPGVGTLEWLLTPKQLRAL
jgi:phosphohistidine phosphatase